MKNVIRILIVIIHMIKNISCILGIDFSTSFSITNLQCLKNAGYDFSVPRCYRSSNTLDPNCLINIDNSLSVNMEVDVYLFPKPKDGNGKGQVYTLADHIKGKNVGIVWLDIEGLTYWNDKEYNRGFFEDMLQGVIDKGIKAGVYSNYYQWQDIMGLDYHGGKELPLWYAKWNDQPNFNDYVEFGGWTVPAVKQYVGDTAAQCGVNIDLNYWPSRPIGWPVDPPDTTPCSSKRKFPYYSRCENEWRSDTLGTGSSTICEKGTVVTTMAMVLNHLEVKIDEQEITPKNLNKWLIDNGGYYLDDLFIWGSIENIDPNHKFQFIDTVYNKAYIKQHICNNDIAIVFGNGVYTLAISATADSKFKVLNAIDKSDEFFDFADIEFARVYNGSGWKVKKSLTPATIVVIVVVSVAVPICGIILVVIIIVLIVSIVTTGCCFAKQKKKGKEPLINLASEAMNGDDGLSKFEIEETLVD